MGSIGTALEKICAIKILVNPTDSDKRHRIDFLLSKYGKIHLNGVSDSLGVVTKKKGNSKVDDNEFSNFLIDLIGSSKTQEERLRKNIKDVLMNKFNLGKSSVYKKIDALISNKILIEVEDELFVK